MAMNKVVLTGKIAQMTSEEAFDGMNEKNVHFDLVIVSEWQNSEEAQYEYFACVVEGKQAETFLRYTQKGASIKINGHLKSCPYETLEGQRYCAAEVVVDTFQIIELSPETLELDEKLPISEPLKRLPQHKLNRRKQDPLKSQFLEFLKDEQSI